MLHAMRPEPVSASQDRRHDKLAADEHGAAITRVALAGTSPCLTEHLDRFGSHVLNLSKPPPSPPLKLSTRLRPFGQAAAAPV
jgi:hypothetical protein